MALPAQPAKELMQSFIALTRRNLVVDIESAIRLAQQQAQLTGSLDPLVAALKSANQRIEARRPAAPGALQRAIGRDLDRLTPLP